MKVELCKLDEVPESGSNIVSFFGREVHVYKVDGRPKAALNICLHFGGPLACEADKFVCQWHNAEFSREDGRRLTAPAPAGAKLMFLPTRAENGALYYVWGE